jgi:hypothetical protein
MSRGLSASMQSAAAGGTVLPVLLWYGDFASGAVRVCSLPQSLSWCGYTWTGLGDLIDFEELRESGGTEAVGAVFTLNGVPSAMVTKALEAGYRRRRCSLYLALLDSSRAVVADPIEWRFLMDRMSIEDAGETSRITVRAESRLADLQRARELRWTDEGQQAVFSGDRGFEYLAGLAGRELVIGGVATGGTPPGTQVNPAGGAGYERLRG